ncbi:glutamate racemase [Comamonas sp. BIGb0124]|uniref:glutamate racemase n=1 Tax=Comamonas sp. BIGb0124 TaxID=2485130 RepID=UPI001F3CFAE9|nr:glutamate racemase [Comamonas sp. BIGb0124]
MTAVQQGPIGVFDSGVGGLSILQALRTELPHEDFVYFADSGHAPYGEREDSFVVARSLAIAHYLLATHAIKALVVACNTATAAAIQSLRLALPHLPIIGVEPALKPAVAVSRTRRIGVVATRGTLGSAKFQRLLLSQQTLAEFVVQPCPGLALALENAVAIDAGNTGQLAKNRLEISALIERHLSAMGAFGSAPGQIDTLVLGCTHYPFAMREFQAQAGSGVQLLETGVPVARQTRRLLQARTALHLARAQAGHLTLFTTGSATALQLAAMRWLQIPSSVPATSLDLATA